ncbi:MAG: TonB-dependent receptor [Candidatus Andeanibacterium colombiense]|uniref:TonB-dependent receptor n=1 Tax=Candidatus Andeanibacterium colombiense TaxID=3121345 RepID=A0AAJ5X924_9SPHN|nr:MAG: TonB-dependent receptor [Sphingomonadaceae bacterium]
MRKFTASLLASTVLIAQPVLAADDNTAAAEDAASSDDANEIVVFGKGQTIQVQEIEAADLKVLTPGTSVIKAIEKLPSVNVQASDPFGNYEWSTRVTIRSFSQSQLGFNFDGIPLGDMSYGNYNGLHISRIVSPENVGTVRVSQGAGAVNTQSTNNLGGTIETFSVDPTGEFGVDASATYGSNDTMRGFMRVNFGSHDGLKGYVSYGYGATDKYRGEGKQDQHMVNAKLVVPVGEGKLDGWFSYSDRREQDYQDMSMEMLNRLGYDSDNTHPDYALAIQLADVANNIDNFNNTTGKPGADGLSDITGLEPSNPSAGTVFPGDYESLDDAYYDASGLRKDTVGALGYSTPLGDNVNFAIKGYYHHNKGMGLWATPYTPSPNGVPISIRTTEYDINRGGVFGSLDYTAGSNTITVGGWYEHNKFNQARRFYALASRTDPGRSFRDYPTDPFYTQWDFNYYTDTLQYFVQDDIDLGAVKINLGWKGYQVKNRAEAIVKNVYPDGKFKTVDWFQPSAGVVFEVSDQAELFGSFSQATRAFPSVNGSIWGTTQAGFDKIKDTIKPETSDTYEIGARYNTSSFHGTVGVYLVNFHDRLLGVASGPDIVGSPTVLQNVGAVRSIGFEAVGDWRITDAVSFFASYTYTDATYRDDVVEEDKLGNPIITPTAGKTVVDAPKHMARGELSYDDGKIFGRFALNYMSKRYYNYLNDASVPGRVIADATLGYHITDTIDLQLNGSNLFNKDYVGTINSAGTGDSGDRQTLLVAAPRQFFVTVKAGF